MQEELLTKKQIAERVPLHYSTVSQYLDRPDFNQFKVLGSSPLLLHWNKELRKKLITFARQRKMRSGKMYVGVPDVHNEIERKWLAPESWVSERKDHIIREISIKDIYLTKNVRFRQMKTEDKKRSEVVCKSSGTIKRKEVAITFPNKCFDKLASNYPVLHKTRYIVKENDIEIEINKIPQKKGFLYIVEVEREDVAKLDILSELQEVTENKKYYGYNIYKNYLLPDLKK